MAVFSYNLLNVFVCVRFSQEAQKDKKKGKSQRQQKQPVLIKSLICTKKCAKYFIYMN